MIDPYRLGLFCCQGAILKNLKLPSAGLLVLVPVPVEKSVAFGQLKEQVLPTRKLSGYHSQCSKAEWIILASGLNVKADSLLKTRVDMLKQLLLSLTQELASEMKKTVEFNHSFPEFVLLCAFIFFTIILLIPSFLGQEYQVIKAQQPLFACPVEPQEELGQKPDLQKAKLAASNLQNTTQSLSQKYQQFKIRQGSKELEELKQLAITRKKQLLETMRQNPDAALSSFLSPKDQSELSSLSQNCIETPATFEGSLNIVHTDFFEDKVSSTDYTLTTANGQKIKFHPAGYLHVPLESRTKVKVNGMLVDNDLAFDGTSSLSKAKGYRGGIDVSSQPNNPPVLGQQKAAVILANFANTPIPPVSRTDESNFINGELNNFYRENSYNKISISGDVFGWYTLPINQTCDIYPVRTEAIKKADSDIYFPNYSRLIIIAPFGPDCGGWKGMSTIGKEYVSTADGQVTMSTSWIFSHEGTFIYATSTTLVGHELGHGFSLLHADGVSCGGVTLTANAPDDCQIYVYYDPYDVMGNWAAKHFNAPHKEYVGWFDSGNLQTVTANGNFVLEPIETVSSNLKAIKIPRPNNNFIYVEYRQRIGFDAGEQANSDFDKGALLHILIGSQARTGLLDPIPDNDLFTTISLHPGSSLTDPATGTKITVKSATSTALTVEITGFSSPSPTPTPTTSPTPTPSCNCTEWVDQGCGISCPSTQMQATRTCNPPGCFYETTCYDNPLCTGPHPGFGITFTPPSQSVTAGESATYKLYVAFNQDWINQGLGSISLTCAAQRSSGATEPTISFSDCDGTASPPGVNGRPFTVSTSTTTPPTTGIAAGDNPDYKIIVTGSHDLGVRTRVGWLNVKARIACPVSQTFDWSPPRTLPSLGQKLKVVDSVTSEVVFNKDKLFSPYTVGGLKPKYTYNYSVYAAYALSPYYQSSKTTGPCSAPPCYFTNSKGQQQGYGDIDNNGIVDYTGDVTLAAQIAANKLTPTPDQKKAADVDGNGIVNFVGDAMLVAQYALGVISTFPICSRL